MMNNLSIWQFPLNLILACAFVLMVFVIDRHAGESAFRRILAGRPFSVFLACLVALTMALEGTWKLHFPHNVFFITVCLLLMLSLGLVTAGAVRRKKSLKFILCHLGFFLVLSAGFWGAPDRIEAKLRLDAGGEASRCAVCSDGMPLELPFGISLKEFRTEYHADGVSPRQYSSTLVVDGEEMLTAVNAPCRYGGYLIFQEGFDREDGKYSVIGLVRDPWLPLMFLGMIVMAAGALLSIGRLWDRKTLVSVLIVLTCLFTAVSVAKINFGSLPPALRSLWFVPHLMLYMLAYSCLSLSLVTGLISFRYPKMEDLSGRLLSTASSLLLAGMLCGAVWAEYAWGNCWTWDAKECWAAVTWLLTIAGTHCPGKGPSRRKIILLFIFLAFAAMQVTWYGVDGLPAAQYSLHTYK